MTAAPLRFALLGVAFAALAAIALAWWQLGAATAGLEITRTLVAGHPVSVFRPATGKPAPAVVIAHGFAGSQQLMHPFAVTLARNGYVAVTFDFPGHGRNPAPLPGGLADHHARTKALQDALDAVVRYARGLPASDGRVALVGHSMASEIVVRYAREHSDVTATVAVSLYAPDGELRSARNLLIVDGALEPAMMHEQARRIVSDAAGQPARERETYGDFAAGSARRYAFAAGAEHIGVLYSSDSMTETLAWMNGAFGERGEGYLDARGRWLALLFAGLLALAWPLSRLLPRVAISPAGGGYRGRPLLLAAVIPAVATPLLLWRMPSDFLPLLLGDYLLLHFALYGVLTFVAMAVLRTPSAAPQPHVDKLKLLVAVIAVAAYAVVVLGWPLDRYFASFIPGGQRLGLMLALLAGTVPWFIADEWLTRGANAGRGAYALTKLCFLASLAIAIALNLPKLFFLVIIVPAILVLFVVYGLLSGWAYRRTLHPLAGALANALAFAWAIAVTFPLVAR